MISVIIPTMWKCDRLLTTLQELSDSVEVSEILLIDNTAKSVKLNIPKVKHILEGKNTYVNPAWNKGASLATSDLLLVLNDDIWFDWRQYLNIANYISNDMGMVGLGRDCYGTPENDISIRKTMQRPNGFACSFFIHKEDWKHIDDRLLIYGGDDYLWKHLDKDHYCIHGLKTNGFISKTVNEYVSNDDIRKTLDNDKQLIVEMGL